MLILALWNIFSIVIHLLRSLFTCDFQWGLKLLTIERNSCSTLPQSLIGDPGVELPNFFSLNHLLTSHLRLLSIGPCLTIILKIVAIALANLSNAPGSSLEYENFLHHNLPLKWSLFFSQVLAFPSPQSVLSLWSSISVLVEKVILSPHCLEYEYPRVLG